MNKAVQAIKARKLIGKMNKNALVISSLLCELLLAIVAWNRVFNNSS